MGRGRRVRAGLVTLAAALLVANCASGQRPSSTTDASAGLTDRSSTAASVGTPSIASSTAESPGGSGSNPGGTTGPASLPDATTTPSSPPGPEASTLEPVALVPVVALASPEREVERARLASTLSGADPGPMIVSRADLPALTAALAVSPAAKVRVGSPAEVRAALARSPGSIGILRASDVGPDVRALSVDGRALFGAERVRSLDAWPLVVREPAGADPAPFDPAKTWTLVAGGDVMLDRAVYQQSVLAGKGVDFPWDGGTAAISGWTCCGAGGVRLPVGRRTGSGAAVRKLIDSADVAVVNLEGPAPDRFTYHPGGLVFTFDPALLAGLRDAGIDTVSIANNHISNAGAVGIADTVRHLDALGISHAGAGPDLAAATRPAMLKVDGLTVAVLAYDAIRPIVAATAGRPGAAPLAIDHARADIRAARAAGADVVIVMPHWGTEYTDAVSRTQRDQAAALVAAGADAVIGSHSHWVGPIEMIDGRPVLYSLGDLVFQLTHDERTMEGALADLTFVGRRLVQIDLHPTLILDGSQPNLLDPAGDGARLLAAVDRASRRLPAR
jgi:poly-gamma-glutamate capsule biosynthesis protein CapA/YwtB (metallophosphatase superfamily)